MTTRTAKIISRTLIVSAMVACVSSLVIARTVYPQQQPGKIVIVGTPHEGDGPATIDDLQRRLSHGESFVQTAPLPFLIGMIAFSLTWLITGSLIVTRQPKNKSGWIFCAIGAVIPLNILPQVLVTAGAMVHPGSIPLLGLWASLGEYSFFMIALIPLLFLLYPDGRPPTPRWRWAQYALFTGVGIAAVGSVLSPGPLNNYVDTGVIYMNPLGVSSFNVVSPALIALGTAMILLSSLSTVIAVRGRFKRSTGEERQRLRWLVAVATLAGASFLFFFVVLQIIGSIVHLPSVLTPIGFGLFASSLALGVPAAYLVAIFRYRLYDLDLVVKKAVVFAVMVGAVMALYLLIAVIPLALMGFGSDLQVSDIVFGVVIGLLVFPVRSRAKRFADRIVYGKRATPYEVLTAFSGRVGETYSTDDVLPRMAQILAEGVGATSARVWLLIGGMLRPDAVWPPDTVSAASLTVRGNELPPIQGEDAVPVRHRGDVLGALSVTMPASDPMTPAKERLVRDLAEQAGLVLKNVRLIDDLRSSRQRLVAAQDEERRKLERNIHDGAQQQLVALSVQLKILQTMIERDPAKAIDLAGSLQAASTTALEDLRDLARGIYPPLLADKGLVVALEGQARKAALPVAVTADNVDRYSPDVEATAYFCVLEALNNIAKYANASTATVALAQADGHLEFVVTDDGDGFDANGTAYGTGLQGMRDRIDAIGGALGVESSLGAGTTVRGRLPV